MLADYHVHTQYSDDSDYPMEEVVQDALRLGLDALCFTDHVDYGVKRDWDDPRGVPVPSRRPRRAGADPAGQCGSPPLHSGICRP